MITSFCTALMAFMKFAFFACTLDLRCINWWTILNTIRSPFWFIRRGILSRYREWWKLIALIQWLTKNCCTFIIEFICANASPSCLETESLIHIERTIGLTVSDFICCTYLGSSLNASIRMLFKIGDSILFLRYFLIINLVVFSNFKLRFSWIIYLLILNDFYWILIDHLNALSLIS